MCSKRTQLLFAALNQISRIEVAQTLPRLGSQSFAAHGALEPQREWRIGGFESLSSVYLNLDCISLAISKTDATSSPSTVKCPILRFARALALPYR